MNRSVVPEGDYYFFNPLAILFTNYTGTTLYSYRFDNSIYQNMNLISALWKTIEHMFDEIFREELQVWSLNDYKIRRHILSGVKNLVVYLVFEGDADMAEDYLVKLLEKLLEKKCLVFSSIMSNKMHNQLDILFYKNHKRYMQN